MKTRKICSVFLIGLFCMLIFAACSSKKAGEMQIYSAKRSEEYKNAAMKRFASVSVDAEEGKALSEKGISTAGIENLAENTRYAVIISEDKAVLDREQLEGKRFTILVHDRGSDKMKLVVLYGVGTTDNCVIKGNVVKGEMQFRNVVDIETSDVSGESERAKLLFDMIYHQIVEVEGE